MNVRSQGIIVSFLVVMCGCAALFRPAGESPEAAALLAHAQGVNAGLTTLKGLGSLEMVHSGKRFQARVAWICQPPGRFRITVLGALGRPVISLVSDGRHISYFSHNDGVFQRWPRDAVFPPVALPVAISPEDIADALSGKIPIRAHDAASVRPGGSEAGRILVLKQWGRIVETIDFAENAVAPEDFTVFKDARVRAYTVAFRDHRQRGGYRLPGRYEIDGEDGSQVTIRVDRYWPNAPVSPETFVLDPA